MQVKRGERNAQREAQAAENAHDLWYKVKRESLLRSEPDVDSAFANVGCATVIDRDVSCFALCKVSGLHGNLVFNFVLGNLILSFPQRSIQRSHFLLLPEHGILL